MKGLSKGRYDETFAGEDGAGLAMKGKNSRVPKLLFRMG